MADAARELAAISAWLDGSPSYVGLDPEAHLVRRCVKAGAEFGEMLDALYGMLGENPRKGVTHSRNDLRRELLDVATAALGAVEHLDGNRGQALDLLADHIRAVAVRAVGHGLVLPAEPIAALDEPDFGPGNCPGGQPCLGECDPMVACAREAEHPAGER